MGLFPAITISIVVVVVIIIIVVIVVIVSNGGGEVSTDVECSNQSDCNPGYVCVRDQEKDTSSSSKCKAGLGTSCSSDSDCAPEFVCQSSTALGLQKQGGQFKRNNTTNGKVCVRKTSGMNTRSPSTSSRSSRVRRRNLTAENVEIIPDPTRCNGVIQELYDSPCTPEEHVPQQHMPLDHKRAVRLNKVSEQEKSTQEQNELSLESPLEAAGISRFVRSRMNNEVSNFRPLIPSFSENRNVTDDGDIDASLSPLGRNYFGKVQMMDDNLSLIHI